MLGTNILEVIEIIIFIFTVIFFIKNYLINFIESDNIIKKILLLTLCMIILISSAFSIFFTIDLNNVLIRLATEIDQMTIQLLKLVQHQKLQLEQILTGLGIAQAISLLMLIILFRNIKKEIKEAFVNSKKLWDWDKIK